MHKKLFSVLLLAPLALWADPFTFSLPTTNQHLTYQAVEVSNQSALPQPVGTIQLNPRQHGIEYCTVGSSCLPQYQSTCTSATTLAAGASCLLWFHATQPSSFTQQIKQTLIINLGHQQQTVQISAAPQIFAAGDFTEPANHIARWDGNGWQPLGMGLTGESVSSLVEYDGDIVAGGNFYLADDHFVNFIARWNGKQWHPVQDGIGDPGPSTLTVHADSLWVGGGFDQVDRGVDAHYLASFFDERWAGYETYLNEPIFALAQAGTELYAGGYFTEPVNYIGRWGHQHRFEPLGEGLNDIVLTLTGTPDGTLYAGGAFTASGSTPLNRIARWDGQQWHALGAGFNNNVNAIALDGTQVYAGGAFTNAIAMWNGHAWQPLAGGLAWERNPSFTRVNSIATLHGDVFVGGYFTEAKNTNEVITANNVAYWNAKTQTWRALGEGLKGMVHSIIVVPVLTVALEENE